MLALISCLATPFPPPPQGVLTASSIVGTCGLAWSVGLPGRARMAVNAFAAMSLVQVGGAGRGKWVGQVGGAGGVGECIGPRPTSCLSMRHMYIGPSADETCMHVCMYVYI